MEPVEEKSEDFSPHSLAGINIQNISGVVNIGNNNIIRNEAVSLYKSLEELENKIRSTDQLTDEEKLNYRADVKTIESQLSKSQPDKDIISRSWSLLKALGAIGSFVIFVEKVRSAIEQIISS